MRLTCCLLAVSLLRAFQTPAPTPAETGTVEGRVVDSITGEPIRKANITLMPRSAPGRGQPANRVSNAPGPMPMQPQESGIISDANGVFRATVPPGTYFARAERNGYVFAAGRMEEIVVGRGEVTKGVTVKLNKHGVITGRVLDEDGEPVARINVQCLRWVQAPQVAGQRSMVPQGMAMTDDLGEYRMFGIAPGRCIVSALPMNLSFPRARTRQTYTTVYFPGVTDFSAAQPIEVTPGSTRQGVDLLLRKVSVVAVSGKVGGVPAAGEPDRRNPGRVNVMAELAPRNSPVMMGGMQHSSPVSPQGDFNFQSVPAGSYVLTVHSFNNQDIRSARLNLEVGDREITNLSLNLEPSLTFKVNLVAEDAPNLANVNLMLQPTSGRLYGGPGGRSDAQGQIVLNGIDRSVFRPNLMGLPEGYYVKSMQLGNVQVTDTLDLTGGAGGDLTITLEKGTAELTGLVMGKDQKPAVSTPVLLVNAKNEMARTANTDAQGNYRLTEIPPGDYRVFATVQDTSDPDALERLSANAEKVTLARSARETKALEVR